MLSSLAYAQNLIGSIDGSFDVSSLGSATYNIPITVRDGYSSFSPTISLSYNSANGNDIAGYGWGLAGISTINAVPHSKYFDGANISGVNIDSNDAYSLDGVRLIRKSGTNGRKNSEYVTEEDGLCKIYIDSAFSGTPKSFMVKQPDGTIFRYGSVPKMRGR